MLGSPSVSPAVGNGSGFDAPRSFHEASLIALRIPFVHTPLN